MKQKTLKRLAHEKDKILRERLELIRQRHRKLILEPRNKLSHDIDTEVFFEEDDEVDIYDNFDFDFVRDQETEFF